jgi:hypothetical protein
MQYETHLRLRLALRLNTAKLRQDARAEMAALRRLIVRSQGVCTFGD